MKPKKESTTIAVRNKYTSQFKEQALERADKDGVPKVAQDLGLPNRWCIHGEQNVVKLASHSKIKKLQQAVMARLKRENARLEEEVAFLKKAAAYFAKLPQ
jgi:transposase